MEESIIHLQKANNAEKQECSEKTCASCFANRGCMYEHHLIALIQNFETANQQTS
jgi:hypothetical protein